MPALIIPFAFFVASLINASVVASQFLSKMGEYGIKEEKDDWRGRTFKVLYSPEDRKQVELYWMCRILIFVGCCLPELLEPVSDGCRSTGGCTFLAAAWTRPPISLFVESNLTRRKIGVLYATECRSSRRIGPYWLTGTTGMVIE